MMETRFEKQQHVNCSSPNVLSEYVFLSFIHQIQDTNYKNIRRRKDENTIGGKDRNTNTNAIKNPDSYKQNPICSSSDYIFPFVEISCINHKSLIFSYFLASGPFNATTKPVRTSLTGRFSELVPANHKTIFLFIFVFVFVFVLTFCISHLCYILFSQSGETELVPPGHKTYNILLHVKQHWCQRCGKLKRFSLAIYGTLDISGKYAQMGLPWKELWKCSSAKLTGPL